MSRLVPPVTCAFAILCATLSTITGAAARADEEKYLSDVVQLTTGFDRAGEA